MELLLYSPKRPVVDISEIFLWLMAVGTIVCASLWTEFVTCEQTDERYNQLVRMVYLSDNLVCICHLFVDECYIADIKPSACARTLDYFC